MKSPFELSELRLHTCENCMNCFLLVPDAEGHDCPRDKSVLYAHDLHVTQLWLKYFTGFCTSCSRLSKYPSSPTINCFLCDCPDRTELPHEPPE